ncbi:MAG: hypothetical protein M3315_12825 [Actinomycetota bacterium]|nr:hypothetical protein [Actinomycetota bacterium]
MRLRKGFSPALLAGVGDDAAYVMSRIAEQLFGRMTEEDDIVSRSVATSAATESFGLRGGCQEAFRRYRLLEGAFGSGGEDKQ